ncbi:MAG: MGMT family protein [Gammaproteobacteria bacterium]|nr:MGMT family protein [Gammaproteobacteria bacterium]
MNHAEIYALVSRIPAGAVATYGQIAALAGHPRAARQVGYALAALDDASVPWHRVINARGTVSRRATPGDDDLQRRLLEAEGIAFDADARIDLRRFQWDPEPE